MGTNILTQAQIRVDCLYPIQYITGLQLISQFGDHSRIKLTGVLPEEERDSCIETAGANDPLVVYEISESGEDIRLFSGLVTSLTVRHVGGMYTVEIEGLSHTYLMDRKRKRRSFQDIEASYLDVIKQVVSDHAGAVILMPEDRPVRGLLLQYDETDWGFLKRVATHFDTVLVPDSLGDKPRFWVGLHQTEKELEDITDYRIITDVNRCRYIKSCGFDATSLYFTKYEVESKTRLAVGDQVTFKERPFIVEYAEAGLVNGLFRYKYILTPEKGTIQPLRHNEKISGLALLGTVLDTRDTYVKIHLRIDETQDVNTAKWFPYASEANNLFYCMPEIGQNLSLYFSNADENSAIAINSVRRNGCNCADMTDPALKRMTASPSGHTFGLGQGDIDFTKHEGLFITLDDGVTVKSDTDIMIAGQNITLSATESVIIAAEDSLVVASGANAQVYLSEETGDANLIAPGMVKFDAEGGSPLEPFSRSIAVDVVPEPVEEEEEPPRRRWGRILGVVIAAVAVAVIVTAVVVTGGAALAALPAIAKAGKAIGGAAFKAKKAGAAAKKAKAAQAKAKKLKGKANKKARYNANRKANETRNAANAARDALGETTRQAGRNIAQAAGNGMGNMVYLAPVIFGGALSGALRRGLAAEERGDCAVGIIAATAGGGADGGISSTGKKKVVNRILSNLFGTNIGARVEDTIRGAGGLDPIERDMERAYTWDVIFGLIPISDLFEDPSGFVEAAAQAVITDEIKDEVAKPIGNPILDFIFGSSDER